MLELDRSSPTPLYRQLKDQVRLAVETGAWSPGTPLPSERELVAAVGVSRITVRQALRELTFEGYLVSAAGRGFFVADRRRPQELDALLSFTAAMRARGVEPGSRVLELAVHPAPAVLASQFGIGAGEEVVSLRRLRLGGGVPMTLQQLWLPHRLVPGLTQVDFTVASLYEQLCGRYGLALAAAESAISARLGDDEEARLLELGAPPIGLSVDQVTTDAGGRVVEVSRSLHHPARLPLTVTHASGRDGAPGRQALRVATLS